MLRFIRLSMLACTVSVIATAVCHATDIIFSPQATFISPVDQQVVPAAPTSATVSVKASTAVASVEMRLDSATGPLLGIAKKPAPGSNSYTVSFNGLNYPRGQHYLIAKPCDVAGNCAENFITIYIGDNPNNRSQCQDLIVQVHNTAGVPIGGTLGGSNLATVNFPRFNQLDVDVPSVKAVNYQLKATITIQAGGPIATCASPTFGSVNGCPKLTFPNAILNVQFLNVLTRELACSITVNQ